jgi:hypothetical protein
MRLEDRSTGWERATWTCTGCWTAYLLIWRERCDLELADPGCPRCGGRWTRGVLQQRLRTGQ